MKKVEYKSIMVDTYLSVLTCIICKEGNYINFLDMVETGEGKERCGVYTCDKCGHLVTLKESNWPLLKYKRRETDENN